MKYLKPYKLFESIKIPKTKINGIYYHGSRITDNEFFSDLKIGYSDWEAIWFSSDEYISEEFSEQYDEGVGVIFQVDVKCDSIADINYNLFKDIQEEWVIDDFRESIEILKRKGYKGWFTLGSIGKHQYDDIAIFYEDCFKVVEAKFFIDGKWTEYMPIDEAERFLMKNIIKNEIFKTI